ncbi:hypothetical protein Dshi_2302 [Dinoroseobacter shibae DFL 12 = DSM 16493]|uniref:Uncharacterized protein n=1 Tax=Dinoroseobacter shibae (strain DSM 16493 / NCIMB 14021 / DFL 12) TaxID=398580 RepID=A8LRK7_DINSH|nr:hypothetical protein [Dinoroseobacter shibae]ABV94038.1 hypothetical protein Dshi_2302 [Dinoroseobacter shibae DFL 12 = DSM 16493]URF45479.1 hypothetical protein M8008_11880 [Dinoroseobacter shibae]URF49784.1 hypothetical protein M8007_11880 [Dinoroseobacter shibae]
MFVELTATDRHGASAAGVVRNDGFTVSEDDVLTVTVPANDTLSGNLTGLELVGPAPEGERLDLARGGTFTFARAPALQALAQTGRCQFRHRCNLVVKRVP